MKRGVGNRTGNKIGGMIAVGFFVFGASALAFHSPAFPLISEKIELLFLLPEDGEAGEWLRHGEPQVWEGEDLFIYINGGAEIYMEYGFRAAAVQDYRAPGKRDISLEIFAMDSPEAAFGMYSFKASGKGEPVAFGGDGELSAYYLNLRKGSIVATLTGFDEDPETVDGLRILASALDARLPAGGGRPGLLGVLPGDEENVRNRTYVKGPLGLANMLPLLSQHLSPQHVREGVGAYYDDGSILAVLRYESSQNAASAFEALATAAVPDGRLRNLRRTGASSFNLSTDRGREIAASVRDDLVILAESSDPDSGSAIVGKTLDRLAKLNPSP